MSEKYGLTTRTPACRCPYCGFKMMAATHLTKQVRPKPGDPCVCIECAELLLFDAKLDRVKPTPAELIELQGSPLWQEIERIRRGIQAVHTAVARGELPALPKE